VSRRARGFEECPHCGARFRAGRPACPECGSDARTGWQSAEEIDYQSLDLPGPDGAPAPARGLPRWMVWAAVLALVGLVAAFVLR
jgi:hypothetical protein